jgi:DNA-binding GntR family transcriptional regulator
MQYNTLREKAYEKIQGQILSGDLTAGQRVSEQSLATKIGISRTPVRSAIRQLESEGMLIQVPRYGTIVKKFTRSELGDLFDLRLAIEQYAAEHAGSNLSQPDRFRLNEIVESAIQLVEENTESLDSGESEVKDRLSEFDIEFHSIILHSTKNKQMIKTISSSRILIQLSCLAHITVDSELLMNVWLEHKKILETILQGGRDQSRNIMAHHIEKSKDLAFNVFDRLNQNN